MTWAPLVARLVAVWDDLPARVALAGFAGCLAVSVRLVWWVRQHYVRSRVTSWRLTTWEKAMEAERRAARPQQSSKAEETAADRRAGRGVEP